MAVLTKNIREEVYYDEDGKPHTCVCRILAVANRSEDGKLHCPSLEFLREQSHKHSNHLNRLTALLDSTARYGVRWIDTKFKRVEGTDGLLEFKVFQLRLFCFRDGGDLIVCTSGCVKKKDRADPAVIETALNWKRAYFNAKNQNTLHHESGH
jgi:hypothetical protein